MSSIPHSASAQPQVRSETRGTDYVIVVQALAYRTGPDSFATESAFAAHLKELRHSIGSRFSRMVLLAPQMTQRDYEQARHHLGVVTKADGIEFVPSHSADISRPAFWLTKTLPTWRLANRVVANAGVVHSGMSTQLGHPLMAIANLAAWRQKKVVVFMVDIDFRSHSWRYYKTGEWSFKSYLVNRCLYDPLKWFQVWLAPRMFNLVFLKSASMVRDFGRGRPNVINFYDTAHSAEHVLDEAALQQRVEMIKNRKTRLNAVYFGRLAGNKGVDRMIEAIKIARSKGADVELTVMGDGDRLEALQAQVKADRLEDYVTFSPAVPYGAPLFDSLSRTHVCLAAPLSEDTPRAAFDAMARGLPIVAFGITYFKDLAEASGSVEVVEWPRADAMADALVRLDRDRERLASMASKGVAFARENTQAVWLARRTNAVLGLLN